jgi:hypothetical protein
MGGSKDFGDDQSGVLKPPLGTTDRPCRRRIGNAFSACA